MIVEHNIQYLSAQWPKIVYLMLFEHTRGYVVLKIGKTNNWQRRLMEHSHLISSMDFSDLISALYIGISAEDDIGIEKVLHKAMKGWRFDQLGREWYAASIGDMEFACDIELGLLRAKRRLLHSGVEFSFPDFRDFGNRVYADGKAKREDICMGYGVCECKERYLAWRGLQALEDGERPEYSGENVQRDLVEY